MLHLHASSFPEFFTPLPRWAQRWVRRTFAQRCPGRRAGQDLAPATSQEVLGVPPDRVTVLPNATPGAAVETPARAVGETLHLVFLGRLGERKGLPELLGALSDPRLRDGAWRATIAGDGDIEGYRRRAAELGIEDRVTFRGWIGTLEVGELLAQAHVLVLPSHAEGLPMSVLESFAAGVPVVCTPVGGLAEVVRGRSQRPPRAPRRRSARSPTPSSDCCRMSRSGDGWRPKRGPPGSGITRLTSTYADWWTSGRRRRARTRSPQPDPAACRPSGADDVRHRRDASTRRTSTRREGPGRHGRHAHAPWPRRSGIPRPGRGRARSPAAVHHRPRELAAAHEQSR